MTTTPDSHARIAESVAADPAVELFRASVQESVSNLTGSEAAERITAEFQGHLDRWRARTDGLAEDVRTTAEEWAVSRSLLAHTAESVGREIAVGARLAARVNRYERVVDQVRGLVGDLATLQPALADRLRVALREPAVGSELDAVVIAMVPDSRWRVGWLSDPDAGRSRPYPFAGWQILAEPFSGAPRIPVASFVVSGRVWPLSALELRGYVLERLD